MNDKSWASDAIRAKNRRLKFIHFVVPFLYCPSPVTIFGIYATCLCPFRTRENKAYTLRLDSQDTLVFCHLNDIGLGECGGGGWTLVIKSDGAKVLQNISSIWLL